MLRLTLVFEAFLLAFTLLMDVFQERGETVLDTLLAFAFARIVFFLNHRLEHLILAFRFSLVLLNLGLELMASWRPENANVALSHWCVYFKHRVAERGI